jgi:hypothetical protein
VTKAAAVCSLVLGLGFVTSTALLVGFVAVCTAEVVVAVLLWRDATTAL